MKVVLSTSDKRFDAQVELRFGRAKGFLLFDTETNEKRFIANGQNRNAVQGAGIQAGQHVISLQPDCLITGHCGPKAFKVLSAADIRVFVASKGTVKDNIDLLLTKKLEEIFSADVEGHWV